MSAIANDGVLMKPHVVRCMVNKKGMVVKEFKPEEVRRVISPETSHRIASIMTDVVEGEEGTGRNARIANLSVAGKTGTSQKFDFDRGRYSDDKVEALSSGFSLLKIPRW